ncbi:MAG: hypothetical protein HOP97_10145 [Terrabacter sp.]|nr:hypothetical protein [Terrabacter sp.]
MGQVTKVLLLLAVVVPVTAYVAGSLASPGAPPPADHSPVILRDAPTTEPAPTTDTTASPSRRPSPRTPAPKPDGQRGGDEARVVTPKPTPVGEDDDDEWDDDGPDDDDTDDEWDD